jgi:chromosome segregation ATPase
VQTKESLIEERDRTIVSLAAEVVQWKRSDVAKGEQIATARRNSEKLQTDLSAFSSQIVELQKRYDAQSKELGTVQNELQASKSLVEEKDRTITTLTTKVAQAKREDSAKGEQLATARNGLEQLRHELSSASDRFTEIQERYAAQSQELESVRDEFRQIEILYSSRPNQGSSKPSKNVVAQQIARALEEKNKQMKELRDNLAVATSRNTELQRSYEALLSEVSVVRDQLSVQASQHEGTIISLTAQVEQWKRADAMKAEQVASTLEAVEKLQQDISASISQLAELQGRYEAQSREFIAVRNKLQDRISSSEDKDRTVAALTAQVGEWKRSDALKEERILATCKQAEDLQRELASTSSHITELLQRNEMQSRELSSLQDELQDKVSGKDHYVSSILSQVEGKRSDVTEGDEITSVRKSDFAQLRRDLAASSSQIEGWKRLDATKTEELTAARKVLEQLHRDLLASSSQIVEYQQRYATQLAELTSQIKQWKHSDAAKAEELATAGKKIEQLRHDLSTSSSLITQFQQLYEAKSAELNSVRKQLQAYEEQSRALKSALGERQSQLDGVQRFVTTADKYADTMIIQMLQKLNAEVQQNSEFMAERMLKDFGPRATKLTKEQSSAAQRVSESIGKTLSGCLGNEKRNDVALYLPIAFQAYLTYYLHPVISSWTIKKDRDEFINEIYERLQKSGKKLNFERHQLFC